MRAGQHATLTDAALRDEESGRARLFAIFSAGVCLLGIGSVPLFGGAPWLVIATELSLVLLVVTCLDTIVRVGRGRYDRATARRLMAAGVLGVCLVMLYFGVFSPAPILMVVGISFFAASGDERVVDVITAGLVAFYVVACGTILLGLLGDPGLITSSEISPWTRGFVAATVPTIAFGAYWQARRGRHVALAALDKLHATMLVAERHRAQLDEINGELAARAAGRRQGRFTGRTFEQWQLGALLGVGAMGEVYEGLAPSGDPVAIKVLLQPPDDTGAVARFEREVEVLTRLRHPAIARLRGAGRIGDTPCFAMERLAGTDLGALLRRPDGISPPELVRMAHAIAGALAAAHEAGIIHRDLKPSNLFAVMHDDRITDWKLLDFGVSQLHGSSGTLTQGAVVGTPSYMAPEQAQGHDIDQRADLFSLAAVLYRGLTGRPPFSGSSPAAILFDVVHGTPVRPTATNPALPASVDLVLAIGLAKQPQQRFADARALAVALEQALAGTLAPEVAERGRVLASACGWIADGGDATVELPASRT